MKVLGLDWGRARIGVAVSDELGWMAHPLAVLRVTSSQAVLDELGRIMEREKADTVVIGLPSHMSGEEGESAAAVRRFAERLSSATGRPVVFRDERLTSWAAGHVLREGGKKSRRRAKSEDATAACLILQGYLDSLKGKSGNG